MTNEQGSTMWKLLHDFTQQYPETPTEQEQRAARTWVEGWTMMLGAISEGCECYKKWRRITMLRPPELSSRAAFHQWSVVVHDVVNETLSRPHFWAGTVDTVTYDYLKVLLPSKVTKIPIGHSSGESGCKTCPGQQSR